MVNNGLFVEIMALTPTPATRVIDYAIAIVK